MSSCAESRNALYPWYAIRVRSKHERAVSAALRAKGYEEFLPQYRSRRQWSDRCVDLQLPLFPGYVFSRLDVTGRLLPVVTIPGVVSIVGAGRSPIAVSEEEITAVRRVIASGLPAQPWPFVPVGCRVYIARGPLAGIEGIVTNIGRRHNLILSVPLLQRSVAVEVDRSDTCRVLARMGPQEVPMSEWPGRQYRVAR